jgi:hypothetical protein
MTNAIDIKGRCALHAAGLATGQVTLDSLSYSRRTPVVLEARCIQAQLERVPAQIRFCERLLMLEEVFVHCPEVRLCACRFGSHRRRASMRMDCLERKMAKHETEPVRILTLKLVNTVARHTCVRAFVVAILYERDRGVARTLDVVVRRDRCGQPRVNRTPLGSLARRSSLVAASHRLLFPPRASAILTESLSVSAQVMVQE